MQNSWSAGYVAEFLVTGTTGVKGWTVTWPDTKATSIVNAWGMTCTLKAKTSITCTGSDWAAAVPAGQTARVGVQVGAGAAPVSPTLTVTTR